MRRFCIEVYEPVDIDLVRAHHDKIFLHPLRILYSEFFVQKHGLPLEYLKCISRSLE